MALRSLADCACANVPISTNQHVPARNRRVATYPTRRLGFFGELWGMKWLRNFYREYKPYVFSDGWYYLFILLFIALLFLYDYLT
jgi:hypothetical protein